MIHQLGWDLFGIILPVSVVETIEIGSLNIWRYRERSETVEWVDDDYHLVFGVLGRRDLDIIMIQ